MPELNHYIPKSTNRQTEFKGVEDPKAVELPRVAHFVDGKPGDIPVCERLHYYSGSQRYSAPKLSFTAVFYSGISAAPTAREELLIEIVERLVHSRARNLVSQARLVGSHLHSDFSAAGLSVHAAGFSETTPLLIRKFFESIKHNLS